jgi:hypothetical protein
LKAREVTKLLLDHGADPSVSEDNSARKLFRFGYTNYSIGPVMRLIVPLILDEIYCGTQDEVIKVLSGLHCTAEEFLWLQREVCPTYFDMPLATRVQIAISTMRHGHPRACMPELIRTMIGIPLPAEGKLTGRGIPSGDLLENIAWWIGITMVPPRLDDEQRNLIQTYWHDLFCDVMDSGVDLSHVSSYRRTPFTELLHGLLEEVAVYKQKFSVSALTISLHKWLAHLQTRGVDLVEFGRKEHRCWKSGRSRRIDKVVLTPCHSDPVRLRVRVYGFTFGSSPSDWSLWLSEPTDCLLADFWRSVETTVEVMPGSWPEESFD